MRMSLSLTFSLTALPAPSVIFREESPAVWSLILHSLNISRIIRAHHPHTHLFLFFLLLPLLWRWSSLGDRYTHISPLATSSQLKHVSRKSNIYYTFFSKENISCVVLSVNQEIGDLRCLLNSRPPSLTKDKTVAVSRWKKKTEKKGDIISERYVGFTFIHSRPHSLSQVSLCCNCFLFCSRKYLCFTYSNHWNINNNSFFCLSLPFLSLKSLLLDIQSQSCISIEDIIVSHLWLKLNYTFLASSERQRLNSHLETSLVVIVKQKRQLETTPVIPSSFG